MTEQINVFPRKHAISADSISATATLNDFKTEMNKAPGGEPSQLEMIPAFIAPTDNRRGNQPALVSMDQLDHKSFGFQNMPEKYIAEILGQNNINDKLLRM